MIPTQGNEILVDTQESAPGAQPARDKGHALTSWLVGKADSWEAVRNRHNPRWAEYWRLWRGQYASEDRNRGSERSRLIAPALSNAIEQSVSEVEEAIFGREAWIDIADDIQDQQKVDAYVTRDTLLEDFELSYAQDACSEAFTNAAIFGTGIIKLNMQIWEDPPSGEKRVLVVPEAIRPDQFIPDPSGTRLGEMLGVFHKIPKVPLHKILEKIEKGHYRREALRTLSGQGTTTNDPVDREDPEAYVLATDSDSVEILEYHGKVPLGILNDATRRTTQLDQLMARAGDNKEGPLVEAIVTIANGSVLLRAEVNPFDYTDRSILAFQWEKVPGRFWGRGVAEKGYNPQKALDAELRSRADSLGYISAPMVAVDANRVPRGFRMQVKPGKVWLTQGPPNEVFQPVKLGNLEQGSFIHGQEMERMVQMGTGSFDTAQSLNQQSSSGASGATSNSALMAAFVKRSRKAIRNIGNHLIRPMVKKAVWRYNQFAPSRYPSADFKFVVKSTLGLVAREVESAQLTQLMGMMPESFPQVQLTLLRGIIENSSVQNRGEIFAEIEKALQPPPPEVVEEQQRKTQMLENLEIERIVAEVQNAQMENRKLEAEIREILTKAEVNSRKAETEDDKIDIEVERTRIAQQELENFAEQNKIAAQRLALQEKALTQRARQQNSK